jgi:arabinofuranan 3-O-arabinosyltransferase
VLSTATVLVAGVGLAGLSRRGMPHRRFLITGLVVGFALVSLGHASQLPGTFAPVLRTFLDGAGAPLRNIHKFDVVLRLPLTMGLAHILGLLLRSAAVPRNVAATRPVAARPGSVARPAAALAAALTMAAIAIVATPAFMGRLAAPRGFTAVPDYWQAAANWLNERSDDGRVLVLPGTRFPNYTWGDTLDEVISPLLTGPAAVRSVIPLSPPNTIRMMDAIESVLASGYGSPGLADYLARAGVSYVLVRNDLDYGRSGATAPLLVQQSLHDSPGLDLVTSFGPTSQPSTPDGAVDELGVAVPALQVLRVDRQVSRVVAYPAGQVPTVVGGPESLLSLADAGLLPAGPTVLAGDLATSGSAGAFAAGPVLLTDGLRLRDVSFGSGRDVASSTLTPAEATDAHDYLPTWGKAWSTSVSYLGAAQIRASSSLAAKNPVGVSRPEYQPYAAFDGDPSTSWRPDPGQPEAGQWIEITLPQAQVVPNVTVHFDESAGGRPLQITVHTDLESATADVIGSTVVVPLHATNAVRTVRVTVDRFEQTVERVNPPVWTGTFGISEIAIPGVSVERTLVMPAAATTGSATSVLLTAAATIPSCFFGPTIDATVPGPRCTSLVERGSEDGTTIDRMFTLPTASNYLASVWARPSGGAALDAVLDGLVNAGVTVTASSTSFAEPSARPGAVVDGDPTTTWSAGLDDATPELTFRWPTPRTLSGVHVSLAADGTPVAAVTVIAGDKQFTGVLTDGELRFDAPITTSELTLRLLPSGATQAYDPYRNKPASLPVAVSEVTFQAATPAISPRPLDPTAAVDLACGSGPTLTVAGHSIATRLQATVGDLLQRREVPAVPCNGDAATPLDAGTAHLVTSASPLSAATRVALRPVSATQTTSGNPVTVHIDQWSTNQRLVTIPPHSSDLVLNVHENTNPGWVATIDGTTLTPIIVDGWQQGWVVPAGLSGQVNLRYQPDTPYRVGLVVGAVLLLLVAVLALIGPRRRVAGSPAAVSVGTTGARQALVVPLVAGAAALVVTAGLLGAVIAAIVVTAAAIRTVHTDGSSPTSAARRGTWTVLHRWVRLLQWLVPPGLFIVASAGFAIVYYPHSDWRPDVLALLAISLLWLSAIVFGPVKGRADKNGADGGPGRHRSETSAASQAPSA